MNLYDKSSLILVPGAVKDGKVYSQRPEDGDGDFTFSRGSNLAATRVDENGLIEKGRENLLIYSNQFDTAWISNNTTETSGHSGYDGSSNAWLISKSASGGRVYQTISLSGVNTSSIYAKANTANWIILEMGGIGYTSFDLVNGSLGNNVGSIIDSNIVSIGNGWYRVSISFNVATSGFRIYPAEGDNVTSATSGSVYIQDAQLEVGLFATDYIETTTTTAVAGITEDLPRLDYSGGASCPSLLLEPTRTNLIDYSEYFYGSNWNLGPTTIVPIISPSLSPEGKLNAYRITRNDGLGQLQLGSISSVTAGVTYTGSFYVKRVSGSATCILFDLNNSSVIKDITDEWTRIDVTSTANNTTGRLYIRPSADGDVIDVYGAQLEQSSYATSYIPTYGASVTRVFDTGVITSATDLIGQTEGTLFLEIPEYIQQPAGSYPAILSLHDGSSANRIGIISVGASMQMYIISSGTTQALYTFTANSGINKIAVAYANNDVKLYLNGSSIYTDNTATIPATTAIALNSYGYINLPSCSGINEILFFKTKLTDEELKALTTI